LPRYPVQHACPFWVAVNLPADRADGSLASATLRYEVTYRSDYRYDAPVAGNHNRLRMRPFTAGTQRCEHFDVRVDPDAIRHDHEDLFGNAVVEILVPQPHQRLKIEVDALVATTDPLPPPEANWADLRTDAYRETAGMYRYFVRPDDSRQALGDLHEAVRGDTPAETVELTTKVLKERFAYRAGVTTVKSTVEEFVSLGAGVCQDFANLAIVLLREHDIAARYISGYFFTNPGASGASAEVETHAWVEALLPVSGDGDHVWHPTDPTNGIPAGEAHVKIGHGRWYQDVPPIEGSFTGGASSTVESNVTMRRLDQS
jgi:transglutaminase-like putative cysteine protease